VKQLQIGGDSPAQQPEQQDLGYTWSQTDDEVELKFKCHSEIKGKHVQIKFGHSSLKVQVAGETLVEGGLGGTIVVDESTYTLQDEGKWRELCVVLGKTEAGRLWAHALADGKS
jgi:hypothetical protein